MAQDRPDLGESVKKLAQGMSTPRAAHLDLLKRLGRYLVSFPSMGIVYKQQILPDFIRVSVDSDFAGDRVSRKSTTGMVQWFGNHVVKRTSTLQTCVGLNVAETEYYALCHGASHGLGLQAFLLDIGVLVSLEIESDSNSARSFSSRQGLGKQKHVMTRYLWMQDAVASQRLISKKVPTAKNTSDILTKSTDGTTLRKHLTTIGLIAVRLHYLEEIRVFLFEYLRL